MRTKHSPLHKIRKEFIQQIYEKILNVPDYTNFKSHTFNVIASLGLQLKAKEEGLFEENEWSTPESLSDVKEKIKAFLYTHIK